MAQAFREWAGGGPASVTISLGTGATALGTVSSPPIVPVDFLGSARRHMHDAGLLETNSRRANSGQLLGFAAECGIKAVMVWLGYPVDAQGSPQWFRGQPHNLRAHIENISGRLPDIEAFTVGTSGRSGSKYLAMIPGIIHFSTWSVDHRYYRESSLPNSFMDWKAAASEVMRMLDEATKDGMS